MITVQTSQKVEVINVTDRLASTIKGLKEGLVLFSIPHTTAALLLCEDDAELRDDLARTAQDFLAPLRPFKHRRNNNPNAEAHLLSAIAGTSLTLAVVDEALQLGTYQHVLLLEMDGPKTREIRHFALQGTFF